jgi:Flp pilus assembly protein TadD
MGNYGARRRNRLALALLLAVSSASLAACQQKTANLDQVDSMSTGSTTPASFQKTAELGKAWKADPGDVAKGLAYANALESLGQPAQELGVLKQLYERNSDNTKLAVLYGKKLVQYGKPAQAMPILEVAAASPEADWRIHSALGSAYDQQGLYDKAQAEYGKALVMKPNELGVLNNMGMSYALQGNLKQAEATLRQALALPNSASYPRIRQNLALVVGLQGRFEDSRKIASEDLPADQVEDNLAYLQKMLSQPNTWQQLAEEGQG